jgi:hypothetical protein
MRRTRLKRFTFNDRPDQLFYGLLGKEGCLLGQLIRHQQQGRRMLASTEFEERRNAALLKAMFIAVHGTLPNISLP